MSTHSILHSTPHRHLEPTQTGGGSPQAGPLVAPVLVLGFAAAVAMWCVWFLTHLPAVRVPAAAAGSLLLTLLGVMLWSGSGWLPRARRVPVAAGAGLLAAGVNLLLLGSKITAPIADGSAAPGASGLRPGGGVIVLGFLAVGGVLGLVAGALARAREERPAEPAQRWLARFAVVAVVAIVPLLTIGGLVTSTASGLAVPDWPGTYGANMFLYPIALMAEPRIYFEHTHRLFGTLVGLTTLTLMLMTLAIDRRGWVKALAAGLFVAVCVQGWMGGARVYEQSQVLAVLHGVFAQVFFAGTVALAAVVSGAFASVSTRAGGPRVSPRLPGLGLALIAALFVQLVMGAWYRHLGHMHPLWTHVGFSLVVVTLAVLMGSGWIRFAKEHAADPLARRLRPLGAGLHGVVGVQFLLGWVALLVVLTSPAVPIPTADQLADAAPIRPVHALIRTAHQANGALLLALATLAAVWAWRLRPGATPGPAGAN
jgi:cytochrome c oxidase assembly protein subunit 15